MDQEILNQAREIYQTTVLLRRQVVRQYVDVLKQQPGAPNQVELTLRQSNAMMAISDRGNVTVKELAEMLRVSPPSASAMVDRLVDMGMVIREQNPDDRREVRICVSELGETCTRAIEGRILATLVDLLEKLGPEASRTWAELFFRVREVLEAEWRGEADSCATEGA